ncbi:Translation initiation factor 2B, beta subunit (eIF-2Bbeta/GCD7) [Phaffia rhodozyma]|uniref:Translation initiation factor eIF2B subunit beta n=1 Tax=Phaffia rhodozyma TaxID=264483 RepID=A0A0F7SXL1_PHARH|nr:Translation initiation factor 2B, beta subunit (eIF-2Bbeta/GCD7) [Phaffia rhodozyma]
MSSSLLSTIKHKATLRQIESLKDKLRRRQISGSYTVSVETAQLLKLVVSNARFNSIEDLISAIKEIGKELSSAQPKELASGNIVRKILKLIREEYRAFLLSTRAPPSTPSISLANLTLSQLTLQTPASSSLSTSLSLSTFLQQGGATRSIAAARVPSGISAFDSVSGQLYTAGGLMTGGGAPGGLATGTPITLEPPEWDWEDATGGNGFGSGKKAGSIKPLLIQAIQEVLDELETVVENVAKGAGAHIHSTEIIITLSHSRTVEAFLKHAAKDKKFTVIIAETAPSLSGHILAARLAAHSPPIPTLLIPDSNIFAFIPRCTKLLLPCSIVLSTGGIFGPSGSILAAKAAKAHSVQVVVCTGQYKLTPSWNLYQEFGAGDFGDPGEVLEFGELGKGGDMVEVLNPRFDYVGPELIDVFLTDHGDHAPSYIYRLIKETYDDEDEQDF